MVKKQKWFMNKLLKYILANHKNQTNNVSIIDKNGSFTWDELITYSNAIANKLLKTNIGKQDCVSIELPNTKEFVAGIIACQIIGAVYVPVGTLYPQGRINFIHKDCKVKTVINSNFLQDIDLNCKEKITPVDKNDNDIEMIIYTSGSTGKPKGVIHTVESLSESIIDTAFWSPLNYKENDRFGNVAPMSSILGILGCLSTIITKEKNVRLYFISETQLKGPTEFLDFFGSNNITKTALNADLTKLFNYAKTSIKSIYVGGGICRSCYLYDIEIFNGFGTSELGGACTTFTVDKPYPNTPIGKCFPRFNMYILDENNNLADEGELCFSGPLALGYLNNNDETEKSFIDNPFKSKDGHNRMFKTGDIAKRDKDGNIYIVGRKDFMVNINGNRVELEEIEYQINQIPGILKSAVQYISKGTQNFLVAYVESKETIEDKLLQQQLAKNLPSYMIPKLWIKIDRIPTLPNNKIDRLSLPEFKRESF